MTDEELDLDIEVEIDTHFDTISIGGDETDIEVEIDAEDSMPNNYLFIENLVMRQQMVGVCDEDAPLMVVPAYAVRNGSLELACHIELTADHVSRMQLLGLQVSLVRKGRDSIMFDKAEDFVACVKTLRIGDTYDFEFSDLSGNPVWIAR